MFCVDCGKEKKIFRDGSCLECYLKRHQFTTGPPVIDIPFCVHCGSFKYKNMWMGDTFDEVLNRWVKHTFTISKELRDPQIETVCQERAEFIDCEVIIKGVIDDVEIKETHDLMIRLKNNVCDVCSKRFGGYHEAIIQLRADNRKLSRRELAELRLFVEEQVAFLQEKGHRNLFITDVGEEHGGLDFYLSDKQAAYTIVKKTQESFGGNLKTSSKNIGMRNGRQIHRMTYLLRLYPFQRGDFFSYQNEYFYVSSLSKNKVHVYEMSQWGERVFEGKDLANAVVLGGSELIKEMIVVSQSDDEVQVMDPENYKLFAVKKPVTLVIKTKMIPVVVIRDKMYVFPVTAIKHKRYK